eukprot:CFRG3365T1
MSLPLPTAELNHVKCHKGAVLSTRLNADGEYCLSVGKDSNVILSNPHRGTVIATFAGHNGAVNEAISSTDNTKIVSAGDDKMIMLWDVATQRFLKKYRGHLARVNCVGFNEDSSVVFSGSYDATVRIWDCRSNNRDPIQVLSEGKDSITSIHVAGPEILCGSVDGTVRTYDIRNGKVFTDTVEHPVTSVRLSNDKQCILLSTLKSLLVVLDRSSGAILSLLSGHNNYNYKIDSRFTSNDEYVVSGSESGEIFFWNLLSGKLVHTVKTNSKGVYTIDYNNVHNTLLSGSIDGNVTLWGVDQP